MAPPNFYICRKCRSKRSLNKALEDYTRIPKCHCGASEWRLDKSRVKAWVRDKDPYNGCLCTALPYPHRKGSSVWCVHSKRQPTEEDHKQRYDNHV